MSLRLNKCVCAIGLLSSLAVIAGVGSIDDFSLERGRRLLRLVGYKPMASKIEISTCSVTNRIEVNGRIYKLEAGSDNILWWEQIKPKETLRRECGTAVCGIYESPEAAAEAAFSELAGMYTVGGTPEAIAPQLKVSCERKTGVLRAFRTRDYIVQAGKFIVYIGGTDNAKAIAETLYTNNVLKVKK